LESHKEARNERGVQTGEQARDDGVDGGEKPVEAELGNERVQSRIHILMNNSSA
jgi:hypothetical protein